MRIQKQNTDKITDDLREAHVVYYGAEMDENEEMLEEENIDSFLDEFNSDHVMIIDPKWWAYAIIVVSVVIFSFLFSLTYIMYIKHLW